MPEIEEMNVGDIEQSLQFSNTTTTMGFQQTAYFTMVCNRSLCIEQKMDIAFKSCEASGPKQIM